jgi:hypothetical protein
MANLTRTTSDTLRPVERAGGAPARPQFFSVYLVTVPGTFDAHALRTVHRESRYRTSTLPATGLGLIGGKGTYTSTSHSYLANLVDTEGAFIFLNRVATFQSRRSDGMPILVISYSDPDWDTVGRFFLRFRAVRIADGAVDYFPPIEMTVEAAVE